MASGCENLKMLTLKNSSRHSWNTYHARGIHIAVCNNGALVHNDKQVTGTPSRERNNIWKTWQVIPHVTGNFILSVQRGAPRLFSNALPHSNPAHNQCTRSIDRSIDRSTDRPIDSSINATEGIVRWKTTAGGVGETSVIVCRVWHLFTRTGRAIFIAIRVRMC